MHDYSYLRTCKFKIYTCHCISNIQYAPVFLMKLLFFCMKGWILTNELNIFYLLNLIRGLTGGSFSASPTVLHPDSSDHGKLRVSDRTATVIQSVTNQF